ncbi:HAD-IA family hydrolase [Streptomyces sp. F63]|nr:HAD-IA family hydrolase [Streptomyces sp. F63]
MRARVRKLHPAPTVAPGGPGRIDVPATGDPHALLRALALGDGVPNDPCGPDRPGSPHGSYAPAAGSRSRTVAELERLLAAEEVRAAACAEPTPYADELVQRLHATGHALAVTTNNAAEAAETYLERRGLAELFRPHVHGRVTEPWLLKPDPDCLHRALRSTGHDAAMALMIGDSTADLLAARAAGVRFLGYARDETRRRRLLDAGAELAVTSYRDVLAALPEGREPAG